MFSYGKNRAWAENLSIILQIGLTMAGCIGFCFFVGLKLDRWLGLKGIGVTVMTLLGVIGGGNVVYRQITEVLSRDRKDETEGPPED
jgi:F0F1-type ATP synthase assembly protein I